MVTQDQVIRIWLHVVIPGFPSDFVSLVSVCDSSNKISFENFFAVTSIKVASTIRC